MPLPWKKSKIGQVSQFISDLKSSSSKHGGSSLVVETGFPTSLVDLMIKSRDRLKKPSKKNKKLYVNSSDSVIPSPSPPPPPPPSLNSTMLMAPASPSSIKTLIRNHISSSSSCNDDENIDEIISTTTQPRKKTFLFMFKLLLILSLGFGTKKIALLVTITAFVLMLVEICGKSLISILKPCQDVKDNLNSVVESVLNSVQPELDDETDFLKNKKNDSDIDSSLIEQKEIIVDENLGLIEVENGDQNCTENVNSAKSERGALIIAENEANIKEEIKIELDFDSLRCGCRWGFSESDQKKKLVMKDDLELIEDSNAKGLKKKTSVKFNSKMLKKCFVPMLRGSKKKKKKKIIKESYLDCRREFISTSVIEDDEILKNRLDYQENADELEDDDGDEQEVEEDGGLADEVTSGYFSQIELEAELKPIDVSTRITTTWNSLLMIPLLVIIILIGLTGGRLIALVATIIWCLIITLKTRIAKKNQ
ncbi:uncharacterized protein LOC113294705 [Papaver somniferum]|uniref:uncharacterized protein LOC113294705 n=1 Tax=Papaver somniferum TaxID=3469 RepID=UPI000E700808|nr:uncharacterized protein LOC113294705 [Papaver somniferum]